MRRLVYCPRGNREGSTLVLTLIMIVMLSALAVAIASMSGTNVRIADNYRKLDSARASAESGQEVLRYWFSGIVFNGTTPPGLRFQTMHSTLQANLAAAGITNVNPLLNGSIITIANVSLDASGGRSFSAVLTKISDEQVQVDVTGHYRGIDRTLRANYFFDARADNAFDYGLASLGSMSLSGNLDILSFDELQVAANAFIMSPSDTVALFMEGKAMIGGTVTLTDTTRIIDIRGMNAGIGGARGQEASMANVSYNDAYLEFPPMHPELFWGYAINTLTTATPSGGVWDNVRIPAGLNPTFSGGATLRGVIYVESPNVVTFGGGTTIWGMVVTNGDPFHDPDPNDPARSRLVFGANVNSYGTDQLPTEPQFNQFRDEIGTFILAPGFRVEFTGTFGTLSGAIGANGISMSGGSGGEIHGSMINYANTPMMLSGNGDLVFYSSGLEKLPAGFVAQTIMRYDHLSYAEVAW